MQANRIRSLLGRELEQHVCRQAVEAASRGAGAVIVVSGEAGIGKTSLVGDLQLVASAHDMHVLTATGAWTEQPFPFGVVRQMLGDAARVDGTVVDGVTPTAAAVLGLDADSPPADDLAAALHGLFWLVTNLALRRPVLLVVDDAQWADLPSLAFVEHLSRRIHEMPCLVVLGVREPDLGNEQQRAAIARLGPEVQWLRLTALSVRATGELVRQYVAEGATPDVVERCHTATGGNPFLLHALAAELERRTSASPAEQVRMLADIAPSTVSREVLQRLARLEPPARRLAAAVAVLGASVHVRDAAAVVDLPLDAAELAADRLTGAGVLAEGRPLSYLHPLLRQAAYVDLPAGERTSLHRRAAQVLAGFGAAAGQAAAHLLLSDPGGSDAAASLLRTAAADALRAGLPDSAVRFLERALAEPPAPDHREEVLIELGMAQARAALPRSTVTLTAALDAGVAARTRADIALALSRATWSLRGDGQTALEVLDTIPTGDLDEDTVLRIRSQRVELRIGWVDGLGGLGPQARSAGFRELEELRTQAHPPRSASAVLLGSLARLELERGGEAADAARLALEAIAAGEESLLYSSGPDVLVWAGYDAEAGQVLDQLIDTGRQSGSPYPFAVGSLWRGVLSYRTGRLSDAEAECRTCIDIMTSLGVNGLTFPLAFLVDVVAERDLEAAEALVADVPADGACSEFFRHARGRLRGAQGRAEEAVADLRAAQPWHSSPAILPWRSSLATVLVRLGERHEAEQLARDELAAATAQQAPRAIGIARRVLGTVLGGADGMDLLRCAAVELRQADAPVEQARALAALGIELRRSRRAVEARQPLGQAMDLAHRCGADVLAAQVREELIATGARPRRRATSGRDALTASELRVARLAGAGRSNREIAHELFLSPWTVARHLTHVYDKLSIAGREQLSVALDED